MATLLDSLNAELLAIVARRTEVVAAPKPSYSLDGESYSWGEYYRMLVDQQIAVEQAIQRAGGPFQIATRFRT